MAQQSQARNPFMLMLNPEIVFAAIENSERLSGLNRHLCRPLDRPMAASTANLAEAAGAEEDELQPCDD